MKNWFIYNKKADFQKIAGQFGISPVIARILRNRDVTEENAIREYLYGTVSDMHDPFLLDGVEEACSLLEQAIENGDRIRVAGDYDIDGVFASYILKKAIASLGADVDVAIPDRVEDGYGLNTDMVMKAYEDGIRLMITCDNGIKSFEPALKAKELGMTLIITDHHEVPEELPEADAVIDPHRKDSAYPYQDLCGAAVAYKLMQALFSRQKNKLQPEAVQNLFNELLMAAGFATVGDVVPLLGENRIFAKEGLSRLRTTDNLGLNALIAEKNLEKEMLEAYHIGFVLGPCINSAGRLKHAEIALKLLECEEEEEAYKLACTLSELNEERKALTDQQMVLAVRYFRELEERKGKLDKILGIYLQDAHESVAGIIAGRLKEEFDRPVFVVTETEHGLKGSGRSIENYNMIGEIAKIPEYFEKFGGHAMACGFTLKKGSFYSFLDALNRECSLEEKDLIPKVWIDMQLPVELLSESLVEELEQLKPFGQSNKRPLFADKDLKVNSYRVMGKNNNALKLFLESKNGMKLDGIMFGSAEHIKEQAEILDRMMLEQENDLKIACLYYPQINEFRGMRTVQMLIMDFDLSRG